MTGDINFCQRCGHRLALRKVESQVRPYCPSCGQVVYLDPKVAAVVLLSSDGKLVLARRGPKPAIGRWSFPSGYVDRGEVIEGAAVREVKEETGLDAQLEGLVGVYSSADSPVVLAAYSARVVGGSLRAGGDVEDVALFPPDRLPPLPFTHDDQIHRDWRARECDRD